MIYHIYNVLIAELLPVNYKNMKYEYSYWQLIRPVSSQYAINAQPPGQNMISNPYPWGQCTLYVPEPHLHMVYVS